MFLRRVRSARLIIECKLGLTNLHDFVVRQVFCIFVLSVKGSHGSKGCWFSCLRYNFTLMSMSLSVPPFLYDTFLRSRAGGVWYQEVEILFKPLQRIVMLEEVFHAPGKGGRPDLFLPQFWLEPLLSPSQDNSLDFLQFHLFPNHIHLGSLKGSGKFFFS